MESGKSGEKSHNKSESVGRYKILKRPPEDSPPQHHSPLTYHYQPCICCPIYNERVRTIPPTSNVKVVGTKSCNLSDILKELEYTLPIISHPEEYYFINQMCFPVGFAPPMLNAKILIEDLEFM